jgi:hypothetical protein
MQEEKPIISIVGEKKQPCNSPAGYQGEPGTHRNLLVLYKVGF